MVTPMNDRTSDLDRKARAWLPLTEPTYYILVSLLETRHGYAIMQNVEALNPDMRLGPGTLYGALTKLLKQGLIVRAGEAESTGERRKLYAITPLGQRLLELECERLSLLARIGRQALKKKGG